MWKAKSVEQGGRRRKLTSSRGGPDGLSEITMPLLALAFLDFFFGMAVSFSTSGARVESLTTLDAVKALDASVLAVPASGASSAE